MESKLRVLKIRHEVREGLYGLSAGSVHVRSSPQLYANRQADKRQYIGHAEEENTNRLDQLIWEPIRDRIADIIDEVHRGQPDWKTIEALIKLQDEIGFAP